MVMIYYFLSICWQIYFNGRIRRHERAKPLEQNNNKYGNFNNRKKKYF